MRGHHLLFRRADVERFDKTMPGLDRVLDDSFSDDLENIVLTIVGAADLQAMVKVIDALPDDARRNLYNLYQRVLWMWRNYVKEQLN